MDHFLGAQEGPRYQMALLAAIARTKSIGTDSLLIPQAILYLSHCIKPQAVGQLNLMPYFTEQKLRAEYICGRHIHTTMTMHGNHKVTATLCHTDIIALADFGQGDEDVTI